MSKTQSKLAVTLSEATCCCWLGVWYYTGGIYDPGSLQAFVTGCEDGTLYWEIYDGANWVYIAPTAPGMYESGLVYNPLDPEATGPGLYRVAMAKPKCCVTYSSVIEAYGPV
jgi:hypothetical protein